MPSQIEVSVYLGSGSDNLLDLGNYLKQELPHLNIILKPINQLNNEKSLIKPRQAKCNAAIATPSSTD